MVFTRLPFPQEIVDPMIKHSTALIAALALTVWPSIGLHSTQRPADSSRHIRLVLVITVDQMRADYLQRFKDQFSGGFQYLLSHGRVFSEAHQDHACTETAVGHSTILSGVLPAHSGIIGNEWYERGSKQVVYCTTAVDGGDGPGGAPVPSPRALRATTLGDWLRAAQPAAKVIAISRKDRAAVLLGGQHPTGVYWCDPANGTFRSSAYYGADLPGWVKTFNATRPARKYFRSTWDRRLPASAYSRSSPDDQRGEGKLGGRSTFPYQYNGGFVPDSKFYNYLISTPFLDELTLDLARRGVTSENMGRRGVTDLLAVSLSSTDSVGHLFGPRSQEIQDLMLRLDRMLGNFFEFLDSRIGLDHTVIVLAGDHGVAPLPETTNSDGVTDRQALRFGAGVRQAEAALVRDLGPGPWIEQQYGDNIYLNQDTLRGRGLSSSEVEERLARILRDSPQVLDAFTRTEFVSGNPHQSPYSSLYANCFDPQNSGDVVLQPRPGVLFKEGSGTTHGSPYPYDTHVPLVIAGSGISAGTVDVRVRTVDIGPTLAELLNVSVPQKVDGRDILQK